jgi:hypothetical protein
MPFSIAIWVVMRNDGRSRRYSGASIEHQPLPRKRASRPTVELLAADALDVSHLHGAGAFRDGDWAFPLCGLHYPGITKLRTSRHRIELGLGHQPIPQIIRISWTRCNFGNARPWLHCPFCGRRVAKLFRGLAGYFCRPCVGNPMYASQSKSTRGRRHFEACKLRLRLGGIASIAAPFPERPRGMHKKTYARLRQRIEKLECDLPDHFKRKAADYPALGYYFP